MLTDNKRSVYGLRLRNERLRLGYTQAKWAVQCGVSKTSQVNYEAGTYRPDVEYLSGAVSLGADPFYLLSGQTAETSAATQLDWELAAKIMLYIGGGGSRPRLARCRSRRAQLLKLLYTRFSASGRIDEADLRKSLALLGMAAGTHSRSAAAPMTRLPRDPANRLGDPCPLPAGHG